MFTNNSGYPDNQVHIRFFNSTSGFSATNGPGGPAINGYFLASPNSNWSDDYTLDQFPNGVVLSYMESGRIYISYGSALTISQNVNNIYTQPSGVDPSDPNYNIRFDKCEVAFGASIYDQSDATAVDWFAIPIGLATYHSSPLASPTPPPLQFSAFNAGADAIFKQLIAVLPQGANSTEVVATSNATYGSYARVNSPNSAPNGSVAGWPAFGPYLQALFQGSYNTAGSSMNLNYTSSNGNYSLQMTLGSATAGGSTVYYPMLTGQIINQSNTYNVTVTYPYDDPTNTAAPNNLSWLLYTGAYSGYTLAGSPSIPTTPNPVVSGANLGNISAGDLAALVARMNGDVASVFSFGFANSSITNAATNAATGLGPSLSIFDGNQLFSAVQPTAGAGGYLYYNPYAAVLAANTTRVYNFPYTDRLNANDSPLLNTPNDGSVSYMVITIYPDTTSSSDANTPSRFSPQNKVRVRSVSEGRKVEIRGTVTDRDGVARVRAVVSSESRRTYGARLQGTRWTVTVKAPKARAFRLRVIAIDRRDAETVKTYRLRVRG